MTTKVLVDAHAGWPVKVTTIDDMGEGNEQRGEHVVPAGEKYETYVTQSRKLLVEELKRD